MRTLLIGSQDDARGFALAGVAARVAADRRAVEAELARVADEQPRIGLVLVSEEVAALAPAAVHAFESRPGAPAFLVVPSPSGSQGGAR